MQYFDGEDRIETNYLLVEKTQYAQYRFWALAEQKPQPLDGTYQSYSFYGDYILSDGHLYDGNLGYVGLAYGKVESVTSLEEGGIITFERNGGVTHSYFHMKQVETPTEESVAAYRDLYYNHGMTDLYAYLVIGHRHYLKTGDICFEIPTGADVNPTAHICTENGSVVFLYHENNDVTNTRACRMDLARGGGGLSVYYHATTHPIDSISGSAFGGYDQYLCSAIPSVSWYVGANSMFHSFYGTVNFVCDGHYLLHAVPGVTYVERYHLYNRELTVTAVLDDVAILPDSTIIGKSEGKEEVVVYGKDGSVVSKASYEKVITLGSYGAAIAENGQVRFIDVNGNLLASIDGYRKSFQFDRQSSGYRQTDDKYYVTFLDMENPGDLIYFWYDPKTGLAGRSGSAVDSVPEEWHVFEYDGVKYDFWELYDGVNGVFEWARLDQYVIAWGHVNPNIGIYAVINTEMQKIEHQFTGGPATYYGDDINTVVYAFWNTIKAYDGTVLAELTLLEGEYIDELAYSEDKTQIIVTIETATSTRTETVNVNPGTDTAINVTGDDELALRYKPFSGIVGFTPGDGSVFEKRSQDLAEATDAFFNEYINDMASSPPLMYYLVHKMGLTKSQMRDYYGPSVPPPTIDYLFIEDMEEAKQALMVDCAFYWSGKVYSFYEVYRAEMAGEPLFDITVSDHAATWWDIYDYLLYQKARDEHGNAHSPYSEYLPYVEKILRENFTTITDLADWEKLGLKKEYNSTYPFLWNLLSGESEIPEYNGLGIKNYSLTRIYESIGTTIEFTFTVTGNSLPETLPHGTYTKMVSETVNVYLHDKEMPETWDEYEEEERIQKGLDKFGDDPAAQAVKAYLWMMAGWELSPFGEWDITSGILPSNYICKFYGDEGMTIPFDEMQRLLSEKFGITIDKPSEDHWFYRCRYTKATDTVQYADTRSFESAFRILDAKTKNGITYVTVQLFADRLYLIPSHKVVYKIGEGEVFLGCEIVETGNYEPRELN